MALFFTSDTHFGGHRTIDIWKRPFGSVAEMDSVLVEGWNEAVRPDDEVWHRRFRPRGRGPAELLAASWRQASVPGNNEAPAAAMSASSRCPVSSMSGPRRPVTLAQMLASPPNAH